MQDTKDFKTLTRSRSWWSKAGLSGAMVAGLALTACADNGDNYADTDAEVGADNNDEGEAVGHLDAPDVELMNDGQLTVCSTFANPPNTFRDDDGAETGVEIEIAEELATVLGLEPHWNEVAFSGIIAALQAQQCDTIMATLYIRPEREEIFDFVPYLMAGSAAAVPSDNPAGVTGYDESLCGTNSIAVTGSTGAGLLEEMDEECEAGGNDGITVTLVDRGVDALNQIVAGQQEAYVNTVEQVLYFDQEHDGFEIVGEPFGEVAVGAATRPEAEGLHEALDAAFEEIVENGRYEEILAEWGLERQNIVDADVDDDA